MTRAFFDGHAGWQTADLLKKQHLPFVRHSLSHAKSAAGEESVSNEVVQNAIVKGFVSLDDSITSQSTETLQDKVKKLAPSMLVHVLCHPCMILSQAHYTWRVLAIQEQSWVRKSQTANGKRYLCRQIRLATTKKRIPDSKRSTLAKKK